MNKSRNSIDKKYNLPNWLWPGTNLLPQVYKIIWESVREDRLTIGASNGELLVDTNRVFPLLLTSQLPTEVLGYIWSLANQKYSGQLTEQELYIVLALIAIAQTSYAFTSLDVLNMLPGPPTPRLNLSVLYNQMQSSSTSQIKSQAPTVQVSAHVKSPAPAAQPKSLHSASSQSPQLSSAPSLQASSTQNSQLGRTQNSQTTSQNPSFAGTQSLHLASSHNSLIGRSHNAQFTTPQNLPVTPNDSQLSRTQNSQLSHTSQLASSHPQSNNTLPPIHQVPSLQVSAASASSLQAQPQVQMYETVVPSSIINSTSIGDGKLSVFQKSSDPQFDSTDDFTEFQSAQPQPILPNLDLKQGSAIGSRLANHNLSGGSSIKKLSDKSKKSCLKVKTNSHLGSLKDIQSPDRIFPKCTVKNQVKTVVLKDTIIRNSESPKSTATKAPETVAKQVKVGKEGGGDSSPQDLMNLHTIEDKYSALRVLVDEPTDDSDTSKITKDTDDPVDDFGDFVSAEQTDLTSGFSQSVLDASMDLFTDFEQFLPNSGGSKDEISFAQETIEALAQLEITASPEKTIDYLEEKYETVIDPEKIIQKEDTLSVNSIELGNGAGALTRSGSVPSLDLKLFLPSSGDEEKETESMHQLIYWEWKQYMESCVLLLQVAANIFTSITSEVVLQEVLNSAQGYNFLCNLAEVAAVCRRVNFSHKEMDINIMGFDDLLMDIDRIWAEMEPYYVNIPIVTELPVWPLHQGESNTCALCLTVVTSGRIIYNDNTYHATCANLWLNGVNSNLPALKYHHTHQVSIEVNKI